MICLISILPSDTVQLIFTFTILISSLFNLYYQEVLPNWICLRSLIYWRRLCGNNKTIIPLRHCSFQILMLRHKCSCSHGQCHHLSTDFPLCPQHRLSLSSCKISTFNFLLAHIQLSSYLGKISQMTQPSSTALFQHLGKAIGRKNVLISTDKPLRQ